MLKYKFITLLAMLFFASSTEAQKVIETTKAQGFGGKITKGTIGMKHVGYMGTKEVLLSGNKYKVFDGTKEVNKDFLEEDFDKTDGRDLFFTQNN